MKKRKPITKRRKNARSLLEKYGEFFVPAQNAIDQRSNISLEQPSPFKPVPSVVTYGIGEQPIVGFCNA